MAQCSARHRAATFSDIFIHTIAEARTSNSTNDEWHYSSISLQTIFVAYRGQSGKWHLGNGRFAVDKLMLMFGTCKAGRGRNAIWAGSSAFSRCLSLCHCPCLSMPSSTTSSDFYQWHRQCFADCEIFMFLCYHKSDSTAVFIKISV